MSENREKLNLLSIIEAIEKIERYTQDFRSADDLYHDEKSFDATMMQFVFIGEMVDRISPSFKKSHNDIPWIKIKNFRNIIAHDYFGIDADEVWSIIKEKVPALKSDILLLINQVE